jgi:2-dehydro-3-deoxyphosphogluconate aldolase/(4S)-4-hydroxy-2-oxoglutarate aldolase
MIDRATALSVIESERLVAIIRGESREAAVRTIDGLIAANVRVIEVSFTTPSAVELIRSYAANLPAGVLLGAGTVTAPDLAAQALDAGASFLVAPTFSARVLAVATGADRLYIPGAFSPTEIVAAVEQGADLVKVFPAGAVGPRYLRDLLGPYPHLRMVPTGGIAVETAAEYLKNGAVAVGLGGALAGDDPDEVRRVAERLEQLLSPYRSA